MKRLAVMLAVLCALPASHAAEPALTSVDGVYTVSPKRVTAGGGWSEGGQFRLTGSIGQAEASRRIAGGKFSATLGLQAPAQDPNRIFQDGFEGFGDGFEKGKK